MTPDEHYAQAERLLATAADEYNTQVIAHLVATAQVHATLATATNPTLDSRALLRAVREAERAESAR